ncbi:MAG: TonB-dependent receptor [Bacteroidota bacterium]|nr:TonB-dependent receptor [Bacteroidota bacterium]
MKTIFIVIVAVFVSVTIHAQNKFTTIIKDKETGETLPGASVALKGTTTVVVADANGRVEFQNISNGEHVFEISSIGYRLLSLTLLFPLSSVEDLTVFLRPESEEMQEVQVTATRSSRTIADIPTRIETISGGELDEKAGMQSANIKMVLTESTGIQTQQTSAVSGNTSIRIQGLDGKYTQLLKDGFPLYSGFSEGLSVMQIPPLDLKHVEVIKGSSSTLYGGGAIAGLINLVTKTPTDKRDFSLMANTTSAKGVDLNTFFGQRFGNVGVTIFASRNSQVAYDPNHDNFSDIPQNTLYNFNPKVFYYINPTATLSFGLNTSIESRLGGDMNVINNNADNVHTYFQRNKSDRYSTQLKFEKIFGNKSVFSVKNSVSYFSRNLEMTGYHFGGQQVSSFSELSYLIPKERSEWIGGVNLWTDNFKETVTSFVQKRNSDQATLGGFVQNNYKITPSFIVESGVRLDYLSLRSPLYTTQSHIFFLPRLSLMYKFSPRFTSRLSGGLGYKAPDIFNEESETQGFRNVMPINLGNVKPEKSAGVNFDINYKAMLSDEVTLSVNQFFFYTRLFHPLIANPALEARDTLDFVNAEGNINSRGWETNVKFRIDDFSIYFGYTFIDAYGSNSGQRAELPLTARNRLYFTPMYEIEKNLRIGYEVFYVSPQRLSSGEKTRDYWLMGISAEKLFKHWSFFMNFENILDSRQSRWQPMYTGNIQNPQFPEIWAPTDGFVYNAGLRIFL